MLDRLSIQEVIPQLSNSHYFIRLPLVQLLFLQEHQQKHEAVELRDNDKNLYLGKSVFNAVNKIKTILNNELTGISVFDQKVN